MTDTEIRIKTLLGLISDRVNEISNPRCELIHEHLQELEAEIDKDKKLREIFNNEDRCEKCERVKPDGELLDNVDKIDVFHIDKHPEDGILMCLCEQNHKEIRADNIRDLFNQVMKEENNGNN